MTDFDALIDNVVESAKECENEHEHRGIYTESIKKNHDAARSALREAIAEVVKENDGFRKMMKSNTFEDLPKEQFIGIIHSMQDNRAAMFVEHEARVATLEAELKEKDRKIEENRLFLIHLEAELKMLNEKADRLSKRGQG